MGGYRGLYRVMGGYGWLFGKLTIQICVDLKNSVYNYEV